MMEVSDEDVVWKACYCGVPHKNSPHICQTGAEQGVESCISPVAGADDLEQNNDVGRLGSSPSEVRLIFNST